MSALEFLTARTWMDDDGYHVWTEHDCTGGRVATMLPWPQWHRDGDKATPSIHCTDCGAHYFGTIEEAPRAVLREQGQ